MEKENFKEEEEVKIYNEFESMIIQSQSESMVWFGKGKDVILHSNNGTTGKTSISVIGMLEQIDPEIKEVQALMLVPNQEYGRQVDRAINKLSVHMTPEIKTFHRCSGNNNDHHKTNLNAFKQKSGVHVIIGTPGRVYDMIQRRVFETTYIKVVSVDDASEIILLFEPYIKDIFSTLPGEIQVGMFFSTLPEEYLHFARRLMRYPIEIDFRQRAELSLDRIRQFYIQCQEARYKYDVLIDFYSETNIRQAIIFCNSRRTVDGLMEKMEKDGFSVASTNASIYPEQITRVIREFNEGSTRALITTDLLQKIIDVDTIQQNVIINYDLPPDTKTYITRLGRPGRWGKITAINFVTNHDSKLLSELEQYYSTQIPPLPHNINDLI